MSAATATVYVRKMVELETVSTHSKERAIERLARDYGFTESQLIHLHKAKAKTCDVGLFARLKAAYYDRCAKMAARLLHEINLEEASGGDAHDQDLADRLVAIMAEAKAKRAPVDQGREVR
ncbi:hypothetical protein [Devosia sp. DBB001]|nr:hypothetical protein [Devosia sp. DBB001]